MEIAFQVLYLSCNDTEREKRGKLYIAYFWARDLELIKKDAPNADISGLQHQFDAHKHLFTKKNGKVFKNWWGDVSIGSIARESAAEETYLADYKVFSQMAHATPQGMLVGLKGTHLEILDTQHVSTILVSGTRYVLTVAAQWNLEFKIIPEVDLHAAFDEMREFKF